MKHPGAIIAGVLAAGALVFVVMRSRAPAPTPTRAPATAPAQPGTAGLITGVGQLGGSIFQLGQSQGWWGG